MALLDNIVDITITRNTLPVQREEFATLLIIGSQVAADVEPRIREYTSLSAVLVDYDINSVEYKLAREVFSQPITLKRITISERAYNETYETAYNRIQFIRNFYAVLVGSATQAEIMPVAALIEASRTTGQSRMLGLLETGVNRALTKAVQTANYSRTFVIYNSPATAVPNSVFPQAAWMGKMLPLAPGSATWAGKNLVGITPDTPLTGFNAGVITGMTNSNGNL